MAEEGNKKSFEPGMIARAAQTFASLFSGRRDTVQPSGEQTGFFDPSPPLTPVAQQTQGRQYDFPINFNLVGAPRAEERGTSFEQLRSLADNYDLLRCIIETRKDQLVGLTWNIVGRNPDDKIKSEDARVKEIEKFFRKPDGVLTWDDWLRMLVEDLLVIDAPTVYPRKTKGGGLFALEIIDGATIKKIISSDGRTPLAPDPAYVQILKGMPASHYTLDELIYKPRNLRSWKQYGFSPVEQIVMTVNIAMRRQVSQLQYYTEGNVPEAIAACPPEWGPETVKEMQTIWDQYIGQMDVKRHLRFVPGGVDLKFTREPVLKDMFDEWLARIVAYAFSVSPQALVQMMNRATAESAAETAELEGLAPLQLWVKNLIDDVIERFFGYDDLVFEWDKGEELDPKAQAEIHGIYLDKGVLNVDEVRKDIGLDPVTKVGHTSGALPALPSTGSGEGSQPPANGTSDAVAAAGGAPDPVSTDGTAAEPQQLGPDGQPLPPVEGTMPPGTGDTTTVQDTAMNGTQITSLLAIIDEVASKNLPPETARAMIAAAFPAIRTELVDTMLNGLANFEKPTPPPPVGLVGPDGKPIAPGVGATQTDKADAGDAKQSKASNTAPPPSDPKAKPKGKDAIVEKLAKGTPHTHGTSKAFNAQRKKLTETLKKALAAQGESIAEQVMQLGDSVQKILTKAKSDQPSRVKNLLAKFNISFDDIEEELMSSLEIVSTSAAVQALKSLKVNGKDALDLANSRAEKWAEGYAADLVKNITESTRDMLRSTVVQAESEGWSNQQLANELRDNYAFSKSRAETIARTETKSADSEGAIAGWRASGLNLQKEWVRSANDADCDICEANEQQGAIALDDSFDSGDDTSPAHPNCECVVLSVINEDEEQ